MPKTHVPLKPPLKPLRLSVFLPCYNEEANVASTTRRALEACREVADDFEVIIVNDGSTDRTGAIADALATAHAEVRVIHHHPNRGYGGALQAGFGAATKDWVFYTDGDGQFDVGEIRSLLPLLERYNIVSAYWLNRQDSAVRRLNAWAWTVLVNTVFAMHLRDIDCAFKIFPRNLFADLELRSMGALIDAEVLAKATYRGYTIGQVGVHHYPRCAGKQTGARFKVIVRAFVELFRLRAHIRRTQRASTNPSS